MSEKKYLSYNYLGHLGRLGNQMFQYAALLGIAKYKQYDYVIPPNTMNHIHMYDCFELDNFDDKVTEWSSFKRISPKLHAFDKEFFENCPPNVDILGFFQTEKYFSHIKDEIRKHFRFKENIINESRTCFNKLCYDNNVISLHIRLTDHLTHTIMREVGFDYYEKALSCFDKDIPVLIFSDDPETCMRQSIFSGSRFSYSQSQSQYIDMCMMAMCKYHIISNSTFAWWGAWLSGSNKIISPKNLYNDYVHDTKKWHEISQLTWNPYEDGTVWESKDVCPDDWILI